MGHCLLNFAFLTKFLFHLDKYILRFWKIHSIEETNIEPQRSLSDLQPDSLLRRKTGKSNWQSIDWGETIKSISERILSMRKIPKKSHCMRRKQMKFAKNTKREVERWGICYYFVATVSSHRTHKVFSHILANKAPKHRYHTHSTQNKHAHKCKTNEGKMGKSLLRQCWPLKVSAVIPMVRVLLTMFSWVDAVLQLWVNLVTLFSLFCTPKIFHKQLLKIKCDCNI